MKRGSERKEKCVIVSGSSLEPLRTPVWCSLTGLFFMVKCECTYVCMWDLEIDSTCWLNDWRSVYSLGRRGSAWNPFNMKKVHDGCCLHLLKHERTLSLRWFFPPPPPLPPVFSLRLPPPPSVPGHLVRGSLLCGTAADYVIISGPFWSPSVCVWD